jgi:hypothetical protein
MGIKAESSEEAATAAWILCACSLLGESFLPISLFIFVGPCWVKRLEGDKPW